MPVTAGKQGRVDLGRLTVDHLVDKHFIGHIMVRIRNDLSTADELCRVFRNWLKDVSITFNGQPDRCGIELQRLHSSFRHERARHAGVLVKVPIKEPA